MIEALNMLSGYDLTAMQYNSADYINTLVEALKLAYADRDTYYGDPKFVSVPADTLLSMKYADERRATIGHNASQEFLPGKIDGKVGLHPSKADIVRAKKIDDMLMAHDTTCVDAIDKDGVMFSATPSGAWLPSVIAGDTGIPLTERAQSFLLVRGHPERTGRREAAARDAESHAGDRAGWQAADGAFDAGRGQPGTVADTDPI
jgi:gamma-glutamyltranspeptidase/glutathione hydrolase